MDIKEQIARFIAIRRGLCKWECLPEKQDKICGSACKESCYKDADVIQSIYKGAGYYQLQADSEGLVKKESRCVKCRAENNGECFDIECTTHSYERGFKDGTVDQKALDDKEKEEAVKKVFKELRGKMWHSETPYCEREYRITVEDYEAILKQTLEELK